MRVKRFDKILITIATMGVVPMVLYFLMFCLLTYPLIARFSTHLFGDGGDGLQNVWNIWWVDHSVIELHRSPWYTHELRFPHGSTLLGHTLTAFNGFMAIPLLRFMTLFQVHNLALIFTFVVGGWTTFLLAHHLCRSYWPSILAGCVFTFSNYHFAHAEGHLNLSSIEWIPLFVLLWYRLMLRPRIGTAAGAAVALFLVLTCEYNFFFYCLLAGLIISGWHAARGGDPLFFIRGEYAAPLGVFGVVSLLTSGALVVPLLLLNQRDPLIGGHEPRYYSMDLLAPFIPGGHWRFAWLTEPFWSRMKGGNIEENSVHLGLAVVILLIVAHRSRRRVELESMGLWFIVTAFFALMSLGPRLQVWGSRVWMTDGLMPYAWMEWLLPPLKVSGVPVRMAIMMTLGAAVIGAGAFRELWRGGRSRRLLALLLLALLTVEYLPKPIPTTAPRIPEYVRVLKDLPSGVGVLDAAGLSYEAMFHQIHHRKPIAFGYLARVPSSVHARDVELEKVVKDRRFDVLWKRYRIRYMAVTDAAGDGEGFSNLKLICRDGKVRLFDLATH